MLEISGGKKAKKKYSMGERDYKGPVRQVPYPHESLERLQGEK